VAHTICATHIKNNAPPISIFPLVVGQGGGARDRGKTTREGDGSAPAGQVVRGGVTGEGAGQGEVGRLAGRASTGRTPRARRFLVYQGAVGKGREEMSKGNDVLRKA
jgi:hypothetical protein